MNAVVAVLAAGASRRFGKPKQLLRLPDGASLVQRSTQSACASLARRAAVVVGASAREVVDSLTGLRVDVVESKEYEEGIAASIRAAAAWASEQRAAALVLCVADQPSLGTSHLDALISKWTEAQCLVASRYAGIRATPAVFPARYLPELQGLRGETGAGRILNAAWPIRLIDWPEGELDIDTPSDWRRTLDILRAEGSRTFGA